MNAGEFKAQGRQSLGFSGSNTASDSKRRAPHFHPISSNLSTSAGRNDLDFGTEIWSRPEKRSRSRRRDSDLHYTAGWPLELIEPQKPLARDDRQGWTVSSQSSVFSPEKLEQDLFRHYSCLEGDLHQGFSSKLFLSPPALDEVLSASNVSDRASFFSGLKPTQPHSTHKQDLFSCSMSDHSDEDPDPTALNKSFDDPQLKAIISEDLDKLMNSDSEEERKGRASPRPFSSKI